MIDFPCEFPVKIIFLKDVGVEEDLLNIVRKHHPELTDRDIQLRPSQKHNYAALTVTVQAQNQDALDALYRELNGHPNTKLVL